MARDTRPTFTTVLPPPQGVLMESLDPRGDMLRISTEDPVSLRDWASALVADVDRYLADRKAAPAPGQIGAFNEVSG